jgi:hypothetical protein
VKPVLHVAQTLAQPTATGWAYWDLV